MLRSTLLKLSVSPGFAHWVTSNPTTRRMARRFVAGETLDEAIIAARACNSQGIYTSLDSPGQTRAPGGGRPPPPRLLPANLRPHCRGTPACQCFLQADAAWP